MNISNTTTVTCNICGKAAIEMSNIDKVFGYKLVKDEVIPFTICRICRSQSYAKRKFLSPKPSVRKQSAPKWNSSYKWGKQIHISQEAFDSYLFDLGYMAWAKAANLSGSDLYYITNKGNEHCRIVMGKCGKASVLWDYDTYLDVVRCRLDSAVVHVTCLKCKTQHLVEHADNDTRNTRMCSKCGAEYSLLDATFSYDR